MESNKSLDEIKLITALLGSVQTLHSEWFDQRSCRLTQRKLVKRYEREGLGFLTKTLPRLGKAFDRALTGEIAFNSIELGCKPFPGSKFPKLFGEFFRRIFAYDGMVLPSPCVVSIKHMRTIFYLFYKYEIPHTQDTEQQVVSQFIKTEDDISVYDETFNRMADGIGEDQSRFATQQNEAHQIYGELHARVDSTPAGTLPFPTTLSRCLNGRARVVVRRARRFLNNLFLNFDPTDVIPKHGPGAVSTKETLWSKYFWSNIPDRLSTCYPIDSYFYASVGHVCDDYLREISSIGNQEDFARVLLVPKDSRGPRLISCEPLVFQWIQQGLGSAIVRHVEHHALTRHEVHFTDQTPNRIGALFGSRYGQYATLDLSEASDRVTVGLVRLLFPDKVLPYLLAARSLGTRLPDGSRITLRKYAPMGSALCFPILALTIWSLLRAGLTDADTDEIGILVYGDDVIVPTAKAANAIELLEAFGLKINRAKSCVSGFFRESCGEDAYKGESVTPLRIRNRIPSRPSPDSYVSWVAYANQFYERKYFKVYELIVEMLLRLYKRIPSKDLHIGCPSLYEVPNDKVYFKQRPNKDLQKMQYLVWTVQSKPVRKVLPGWKMLLRYFSESPSFLGDPQARSRMHAPEGCVSGKWESDIVREPFSVSSYTKRGTIKLVRRWQ
jgi:hypothetical protein